jgi:hypothetical protein
LFIFFYEKENEPKEIAPRNVALRAGLRFSNRAVAVELAIAQTATTSDRPILRYSARHKGETKTRTMLRLLSGGWLIFTEKQTFVLLYQR